MDGWVSGEKDERNEQKDELAIKVLIFIARLKTKIARVEITLNVTDVMA